MTTGRDPGELGLYGFRNRRGHDYREMEIVNSSHVTVPRVWSYLEDAGMSSILLGIPQTYPPKPHKGITVSGFPVPDSCTDFTYPPELSSELRSIAGDEYSSDIKDFRTKTKVSLLSDIYRMVESRFRVAGDFLLHRPWEFFMMVEIATDRLHHGFWKCLDADHRGYEPGSPYGNVIKDFYRYLDSRIGSLLALLGDDTTVMVVSDHGARSLVGGVCINEWLIRNGFLVLRQAPSVEMPLTSDLVDWSRTTAWSEGGYYARVFLNVKGREPDGIVEPSQYEALRGELATRLQQMTDETGAPLSNRVLKPEEIYHVCRNVPPDLIVYFDGLSRRSIGTVGHGEVLRPANSTGLDDANHDPQGIFISTRMSDLRGGIRQGRRIQNASCLDITPTILREYGLPIPADLRGKALNTDTTGHTSKFRASIPTRPRKKDRLAEEPEVVGYSPEEEELVKKRLMELGYV